MKTKQQKQEEAKVRQAEYNKLTSKQKFMKLNLQVGDKGAIEQRLKLEKKIELEVHTGAIANGVGDSSNKPEKKPYQKPKRS